MQRQNKRWAGLFIGTVIIVALGFSYFSNPKVRATESLLTYGKPYVQAGPTSRLMIIMLNPGSADVWYWVAQGTDTGTSGLIMIDPTMQNETYLKSHQPPGVGNWVRLVHDGKTAITNQQITIPFENCNGCRALGASENSVVFTISDGATLKTDNVEFVLDPR